MRDVDDRIRALDPFAGAPYAHADEAAMVERVAAARTARRRRTRRRAGMAPFAGVAAASLAVAGLLVTAGSSAPQALSLRVAGPAPLSSSTLHRLSVDDNDYSLSVGQGAQGTVKVFGGAAFQWNALAPARYAPTATVTYRYEVGASLPSMVPDQDAYEAVAPSRPMALLARWAAVLGVPGAVVPAAQASTWGVGGSGRHRSALAALGRSGATGLYEFTFATADRTVAACPIAPHVVLANRRALEARLSGLLARLGLRYTLVDPRLLSSMASCGTAVTLAEQLAVGGVPTDQSVAATYDVSGRLVRASFPVFRLGSAARYALVSPAVTASALVHSTGTHTDAAEGAAASASATATREQKGVVSVPRDLMTVVLRTATISLRAFETASGDAWFVPVYELTGDGYSDLVRPEPTPWSGAVLAVAPPAVTLRGAGTQIHVFDERPFAAAP